MQEFSSVFMKASVERANPHRGGLSVLYQRELDIYQKLLPQTPGVPMPKVYYMEYDPESKDFLSIMENLTVNYKIIDQLEGCSLEKEKAVISVFARLHAKWWENPSLVAPEGEFFECFKKMGFQEPESRAANCIPNYDDFFVPYFLFIHCVYDIVVNPLIQTGGISSFDVSCSG